MVRTPRVRIVASSWVEEADARLDAGHYGESWYEGIEALEHSGLQLQELGKLCGRMWHPVQDQARSNFKRVYTEPQYGIPFVSSRDMFWLPLRPHRFLSKLMPKLPDLMVPRGWVVVSRSGTLGNPLYINATLSRIAISDHVIRLEPLSVTGPYLYGFLSSTIGQKLITRGGYGSTVEELEPKHLALIPVPRSGTVEREVTRLIEAAYDLRDESQYLFSAAERDLYLSCGLAPFTSEDVEYLGESPPKAFVVTASELGIRFDASHHVPIARSAIHKLRAGRFEPVRLQDTSAAVTRPGRFKRVYVGPEHGVPFFQPSYVPAFRPHQVKFISKRANARDIDACMLQADDILVTRSGTAARCCLVTAPIQGWAGSDDLLRVTPGDDWEAAFLTAFMLTDYARHQILAEVYGGVIDHVDEIHVEGVLCPLPPTDVQVHVGGLIRAAYDARDRANALEDEALHMIDEAICR
jgi:type I restriction enzyme, S subunit